VKGVAALLRFLMAAAVLALAVPGNAAVHASAPAAGLQRADCTHEALVPDRAVDRDAAIEAEGVPDAWAPHDSKVDRRPLPGGKRRFKIQYYEAGGFAERRFDIQRR